MGRTMLYGLEITTIVAVAVQPAIAQTTGMTPMDNWSQMGVVAVLGSLLWWQIARAAPEIQRLHTIEINRSLDAYANHSTKISENIVGMTEEIRGMREDAVDHQKEWVTKLEERPCLGLEGFKKLEEALKKEMENAG